MPYIAVHTSKILTEQDKDALKTALGQVITRIPGKKERALMVDLSDGHAMYFGGEKRELAYLDVKCYGAAEFEDKKAFTEAVFQEVERLLGLPADAIYLTFGEFSTWGTGGTMK